jgi:hypothetical protein
LLLLVEVRAVVKLVTTVAVAVARAVIGQERHH